MKLLFGFLLLLSIGLFAFMQWGGALTGATKNSLPLAELNPGKIKLRDMPVARQMPASAVFSVPQAAVVSAPVAVSAPPPIAVSPPLAASAPLPAPVTTKTVVSALSVVSAPLSAPSSIPVSVPMAKAAAKACMEWGEFSGTDLMRADKALSELKLGDRLARRTVEYASGYWVYIPPLKNQAAINKKIEQIKEIGVEDYFVVQEPPLWVNVISLGVFKTREAAQNFLISLKKKGMRTAKVGERKRKLKFTVFVLKQIDAEGGARLSALQKYFLNSELTMVACN